ncbi:hypothetical protein [Euzebya sp.]|uniref:hypothetical protein n=1 Tax=Euzebya sp. TaxID=1971409 RepID=UPI0035124F08
MTVGVRRFRSVEEMPDPDDPADALEGLANACAMSRASGMFGHDVRAARGVRRFRSVEEADAHRTSWESARPDPVPPLE